MDLDGESSYRATATFHYKNWWDHTKGFFRQPMTLIVLATSVFGGLWLFFETAAYFLDIQPKGFRLYAGLLAIAVLFAAVRHWYEYRDYCPSGLESVSPRARRIAHLQQLKWEYQLTKILLAERLGPLERECNDLLNGNVFVYATKMRNVQDYLEWIETRIANMTKMTEISADLLTQQLASAMISTKAKIAQLKEILGAVESVERLYRATVEFERFGHAIIPPDGFEILHKLQKGWTEPIRDAVRQAFQRIEQICDVDPESNEELNLVFNYRTPDSLATFMKESERLRNEMLNS